MTVTETHAGASIAMGLPTPGIWRRYNTLCTDSHCFIPDHLSARVLHDGSVLGSGFFRK
jgi:hypothetical protein